MDPKTGEKVTANFTGSAMQILPNLRAVNHLMLISVRGNLDCTNGAFRASALEAISRFGHTAFLICDIPISDPQTEARILTDEEINAQEDHYLSKDGRAWLENPTLQTNNLQTFILLLEQLQSIPPNSFDELCSNSSTKTLSDKLSLINTFADGHFKIYTWNDFLQLGNSLHFSATVREAFKAACTQIPAIENEIVTAARDYAQRNSRPADFESIKQQSQNFIRTESVIIPIAALAGFNLISYPGAMPVLTAIRKEFIRPSDTATVAEIVETDGYVISSRAKQLALIIETKVKRTLLEQRRTSSGIFQETSSSADKQQPTRPTTRPTTVWGTLRDTSPVDPRILGATAAVVARSGMESGLPLHYIEQTLAAFFTALTREQHSEQATPSPDLGNPHSQPISRSSSTSSRNSEEGPDKSSEEDHFKPYTAGI